MTLNESKWYYLDFGTTLSPTSVYSGPWHFHLRRARRDAVRHRQDEGPPEGDGCAGPGPLALGWTSLGAPKLRHTWAIGTYEEMRVFLIGSLQSWCCEGIMRSSLLRWVAILLIRYLWPFSVAGAADVPRLLRKQRKPCETQTTLMPILQQ